MAYTTAQIEHMRLEHGYLTVLHCNVRSIRKNLDTLIAYVSKFTFSFDIIAVTETWLREGETAEIPGYYMHSQPRKCSARGGGVALFLRRNVDSYYLNECTFTKDAIESLFVRIKGGITVGVIYRPPNSSKSDFISAMESILLSTTTSNDSLIICGDFNIDLSKDDCPDYTYLLPSFHVQNVIAEPTRITNNSATLIDHILCNIDMNVSAGVWDVAIADHCPTFVFLPPKYQNSVSDVPVKRKTRVDYDLVRTLLNSVSFEDMYDEDVQIECETFVQSITRAIEQSTRQCSRHNYQQAICPWLSTAILDVLKKKDSYYRRWKNNKTNDYYHSQFKYYRNKSVAMMRKSKKQYYTDLIARQGGDNRKVWRIVNDVIGTSRKDTVVPDNPSTDVCNYFNTYFTNIGKIASNGPIADEAEDFPMTNNVFNINTVTQGDIINIVNQLSENKAVGYDAIQAKVVKQNIDILSVPLHHIINHAINSGSYPNVLKIARVVPVYKTGDPNNPNSYRPISVLSVINTIFEKLISIQLKKYLQENHVICPQQHGFVPNRTTSSAVVTLAQVINSALHKNQLAIGVFLDIKKAFDSVNHSILINKLEKYGIIGNSLKFFASYLSSRKQKVVIDNHHSSYSDLTCGVPQGSVLGPILFSLYVNDLPLAIQNSKILMYADDTAIIFCGDSLSEMQDTILAEMDSIYSWFLKSKLTINTDKTKCVIFHSRRKVIDNSSFSVYINDKPIENVTSFKYLGVVFDSHLHWKEQIQKVCKKLAFSCFTLTKARSFFPCSMLRSLYFTLFQCHIIYCTEAWGLTYETYFTPLYRLQRRALRIISFSAFNRPVNTIFKEFRVLSFSTIREYKISLLVNTIINHNFPVPLARFSIPVRSTRQASNANFNLPMCHNVYGERLIEFYGAKVWNDVPIQVKTARNFKLSCKMFYLDKQNVV